MENKQTLMVILIGALTMIGIVGAIYIGQQSGSGKAVIGTTKRFTAKPGTMRKNAVALISKKRRGDDTSSRTSRPADGDEDDSPLRVQSLSGSDSERQEERTPEEQLIQEAMAALSTEEGLDKLIEASGQEQSPEAQAQIQAALAVLYAQMDPPDMAKSEAAFQQALEQAPTLDSRQRIVQQSARLDFQQGRLDAARQKLEAVLAEEGPASVTQLQLSVLLGQLHERDDERDSAEAIYENVFNEGLAKMDELGAESGDVLRLAALRLARIYRATDRAKEADALARKLKTSLMKP